MYIEYYRSKHKFMAQKGREKFLKLNTLSTSVTCKSFQFELWFCFEFSDWNHFTDQELKFQQKKYIIEHAVWYSYNLCKAKQWTCNDGEEATRVTTFQGTTHSFSPGIAAAVEL